MNPIVISNRTTHRVPLRRHPSLGVVYADFSGTQTFEPQQDSVLFLQDESQSGSAIQYSDLKQRVEALGGHATAREVLGQDDQKGQEVGAEWLALAQMPLGLTHPIVDYALHSDDKGMTLDYVVQHKAKLIPSDPEAPADSYACADLNGDGVSDPSHDSLLYLVSNLATGPSRVTAGLNFQTLTDVLRDAGGEADDVTLGCSLAKADGLAVNSTEFKELPERLHGESTRDVKRHFSLTDDGSLEIAYTIDPRS